MREQSSVGRFARRVGPMAWVWGTVIAATFICVALFWNQGRQRRVIEHATGQQASVHQAQKDLAKGYLHISLAGLPGSPFDRVQGLALLNQAGKALERALRLQRQFAAGRTTATADNAESYLAAYVRAVSGFRDMLAGLEAATPPGTKQQTELRIAFFTLERQADAAEFQLRKDLARTLRRYDRFYGLIL